MSRAPGFGASRRHGKTNGQFVQFLKNIFHRDALLETRADDFAELRLDILANDKHKPAETGAQGVIDGIINDGLAIRPHGINLLKAAIAAAHSGRQYQ